MAPENSMACNILHVYTSWSCSGLCLWWIGKFHIWVAKTPESVSMILFLLKLQLLLSLFVKVGLIVLI